MEKIDKDCLSLILSAIEEALRIRNNNPLYVTVWIINECKENQTRIGFTYANNQVSYTDSVIIDWDSCEKVLNEDIEEIQKINSKIEKLKAL